MQERENHVYEASLQFLRDLTEQLVASCREDERRTIAGREQSVGAGLVVEQGGKRGELHDLFAGTPAIAFIPESMIRSGGLK